MKSHNIFLAAAVISFAALPLLASAHEHNEFKIGNKTYQIVIGSLNEPIAVDDKTGVDVRISEEIGGHHDDMADEFVKPVTGLETALKVELIAGGKKKVLDISPAYKDPGDYRAYFIPTIQTTYTYRVFGKINGVEVNFSFSCNPAGHVETPEEMKPIEISPGVTQTEKSGGFGCPASRADLGFPESSPTLNLLSGNIQTLASSFSRAAASARSMNIVAIILGIVGTVAGIGAWMKRK